MAMLGIADQIRSLNESQLQNGKLRVEALFLQYRGRLAITVALVIGLGLVLAAFSIRKILALENASAASQEALQHLSARLVEAQEEERRSMSANCTTRSARRSLASSSKWRTSPN